ncbi:MAG: DUF1934 domain-containing protein [Coprococcus sp.]
MTEDVILTVSGRQMDLGEDASTELIAGAAYYYRNGKHFVIYDEPDPDSGGQTGNTIKIAGDRVDVIRRGAGSVHMVFEKEKQITSCYHTPAGDIWLNVYTSDIRTVLNQDVIETNIDYTLHMNDIFISECRVTIKIMSKGSASLHISAN